MINLESMSMEEISAYVCQKLEDNGYTAVLSGGSCMEIYTNQLYSSYDIDFVMTHSFKDKDIVKVMEKNRAKRRW